VARVTYRAGKRYDHTLAKMAKKLPTVVDKMVKDSMEEGREFAYQVCPKDTTRLSKTIRVERVGPAFYRLTAGNVEGFDGKFVDYQVFVEYDQPYMHPGFNVAQANLRARMKSLKSFLGESL
jgi:hypothetical protein